MYALAAVFLLLSGASGLIYEVSWARLFSAHIGSDSAAISIVLSSFFLGLALGAYLSAYLGRYRSRLISIYLGLELLIGISALCSILLFSYLDQIIQFFPFFASSLLGKLVLSLLVLIIPTSCIGATFPIVCQLVVDKQKEMGMRIGQLYFFNTAGAVLGSLAAGLLLIPAFGLDGAIYFAVLLNFVVVLLAWNFRKYFVSQSLTHSPKAKSDARVKSDYGFFPLFSLAIGGFVLLASEVAWTKYLTILTGSSLQSFSIILACTLLGIALGSWVIKKHILSIKHPLKTISMCFLGIASLLVISRWSFNTLPWIMSEINALSLTPDSKQNIRYLLVAGLLLPTTFLFGVAFPILLHFYAGSVDQIKSRLALAYSMNTVAGIFGALIAGFWILPEFGTDTLLFSMIFVVLTIPISLLIIKHDNMRRPVVLVLIVAISSAGFASNEMNYGKLISMVNYRYKYNPPAGVEPEFLYLNEGKNSIVSLVKYNNDFALLQNNGLQESMVYLRQNENTLIFETLQAYLPFFIHPNPKTAFVVGYGGGITTQALVDTTLKQIDVVEIEQNIVNAIQTIPEGPAKALNDGRVNLEIGDARSALLVAQKKYDIITSQPSHPWVSGSANLFTKEFFSLVKSRLNDNGIFSQWIALFGVDTSTLKSILKSFYQVYPSGFTLINKNSGDLMLIGAKQPVTLELGQIQQRMAISNIKRRLDKFQITKPSGLFWFFSLSNKEILATTHNSELNTDWNILSETRLSSSYANNREENDPYTYIEESANFDILPFLPAEEAKYQLFEMGKDFLNWDNPVLAEKIASQIESIDEKWGKSLTHEIFFWKHDYVSATALYNQHQDMIDITHYRQFQISLEQKDWETANNISLRIESVPLRRLSHAMILFAQNNWSALANLIPQSQLEQSWQLVGKLKLNDTSALEPLARMTEVKYDNLTQLQTLADAYRQTGYIEQAKLYEDHIKVITQARVNLYASFSLNAKREQNHNWALALEKEMQRLSFVD